MKKKIQLFPKKQSGFLPPLLILFVSLIFSSCYTQPERPFLKTQGQDFVTETGEKVFLRGVGLGNWMLPEGYMWKFGENGDRPRKIEKLIAELVGDEEAAAFWKDFRANYITEADIKRIAELGYNSVRPALNSRLFVTEGETNEFIDEGFLLLDSLVSWCKKYNLYVIIDMHGAPGGQTGQNIDDSPNDLPELFSNPKNQDLLEELWVRIATRYKDESTVAAYDLLNEPLPERTGAAEQYKDQLMPLYKRLIAAIRKVDQKHMFTLEGYNWANNWSEFDQAPDSNMFFQFHYYCWTTPDSLHSIDSFLKKRDQLNTPVWVGETGEKNNAIYHATAQYFAQNNIGWSFWPWKKMDTQNTPYSIIPPKGWEKVIAYSKGGEKPSVEESKAIFAELRENIKLENCVYFPDVVNSMMCRIPLKIEAENYGFKGLNESYGLQNPNQKSSYFRRFDPVPVVLVDEDGLRWNMKQVIELQEKEWVNYDFECLDNIAYSLELRLKPLIENSEINVVLNEKVLTISSSKTDWMERSFGKQYFKKGKNTIKLQVKTGAAQIDWLNVY